MADKRSIAVDTDVSTNAKRATSVADEIRAARRVLSVAHAHIESMKNELDSFASTRLRLDDTTHATSENTIAPPAEPLARVLARLECELATASAALGRFVEDASLAEWIAHLRAAERQTTPLRIVEQQKRAFVCDI